MFNTKTTSLLLTAGALALLAACGAPADPAHDKMMADCKQMMAADSTAKATMNTNKEAVKKVFAMFESGKTDGIETCVADNMVEHSPTPGITSTGLQGLKDAIAMNHAAFPDTKITVLSLVAEGDLVTAHYNMKGTNSGAMGSMPATNKTMDVNGVDIVRFENGKGVEHWGYWEEAKMMQQLGLAPPPAEAGKAPKK